MNRQDLLVDRKFIEMIELAELGEWEEWTWKIQADKSKYRTLFLQERSLVCFGGVDGVAKFKVD